jgi:outer membrane protein assembly complex protein YaeT
MTTSSIEDILDLDNFYSANPNIGQELANKIRTFYLSRGYARVEVSSNETDGREAFEKKVSLTIEEGPRIKIQKIVVNGKITGREDFYEEFLRKNSSALIKSGYYNKDDFDAGMKNLIVELQNQGHLLSKILSSRTQYNREKNQLTVVINIDEGPVTEIANIEFEGNSSYNKETLLSVSKMSSSGPLRLNEIDAAIVNIKNYYHENGYIEMILLNEKEDLVTYDDTNTKASLNFRIFEGPQVKVAAIVLEGNNFTKDYVILKELEFERGENVTPAKVDESIARLQRTGFFSTVEIKTLEEKTNVANRTVIVRVTERDPGILALGAGATSERTFTIRGYAGLAYRNLRGTGRGVSLRLEGNYNIAQVKYLESKIILGYLEPYLFNTRVRGRINLSRTKSVTDYDLRQVTEVNQITYSVEKDFTSHVLGIYEVYSLASIKQTGIDNTYKLPTNILDIATTGPSIDIDFRDSPFNPTIGTFTRLSAEYSSPNFPANGLGSTETINYIRSTASFTHYLKFADSQVVFANNVQGGYLENLSNEPNGGVPYDIKGFILGGRSTVRGFEAGTSDVFPNKTDLGSDQYNLTTNARMFLIKSELRFPIYGSFAGATFYDGGYVSIQNLNLPDKYRDSVGVGLRYNTPVGPLNLEWAWKLDRKQGEAENRFHLSIGTF